MGPREPLPQAWTVHTEVFEGPLDLLLYLVKRDGIDLKTFPVARVCEGYLATLERMRELNLSVASEHLVMASTLIHLKSLDLLPRLPTVLVEEEDPRETLVQKLREYARLQGVAEALGERPWLGRDQFPRGVTAAEEPAPRATMDAFALLDLYHELLRKAEEVEPVYELQGGSGLSFEAVCEAVLDALAAQGGRGRLQTLLLGLQRKAERVLTFIGVLEMVRLGWISLSQDAHLGPVDLELKLRGPVDFGALSGWVEAAS